ncbi:unnamed protein product [Knipowitschia caucasica]
MDQGAGRDWGSRTRTEAAPRQGCSPRVGLKEDSQQVQMVSSSHHETDKGTKHFSTLRKQQITIINIRVQFHRSLRFVELVSWCSGRLGARSFLHVMCSGYAKSSQILKASALAFCPGQPL